MPPPHANPPWFRPWVPSLDGWSLRGHDSKFIQRVLPKCGQVLWVLLQARCCSSQGLGAAPAAAHLAAAKCPPSPSQPCFHTRKSGQAPLTTYPSSASPALTPAWSRVRHGGAAVIGEGDFRAILVSPWEAEMASMMVQLLEALSARWLLYGGTGGQTTGYQPAPPPDSHACPL
jgi:hypothetical protein